MDSRPDEHFEEIAKIVRVDVGMDDQIQLDVIEFLRRLKRQGYIIDYVRVPDDALPDAEAKYNPNERNIFIRESVYAGAEDWNSHCRFTIVHECAHALLNHRHERKRSFSYQAKLEMKVGSVRRDETAANKLGAAIISPFHRAGFSLDTTAQQLGQRFGLSAPAASTRLVTLLRIYRRQHNLPRPLPAGVIDFLAKKRHEGHTVTSLPSEDIASILISRPKYEGDLCPSCHNFSMVRVGTCLACTCCGAKTGDE